MPSQDNPLHQVPSPPFTMQQSIANIRHAFPQSPAIIHETGAVTYEELDGLAARAAARLASLVSISPGDVIAIALPRCPDLIVAQLAVMKLGAAYLVIDPRDPPERRRFLLRNSCARAVIAQKQPPEDLIAPEPTVIPMADLNEHSPTVGVMHDDYQHSLDDLAYITYTSGSTGRPKAVGTTHRGIANLIAGVRSMGFEETDRMLHLANPTFDASTFEVWCALALRVPIVSLALTDIDLFRLRDSISQHGVTTLFLTPSVMNVIVETDPRLLGGLRRLIVGGEAMSATHAARLSDALPHLSIYNGYGPTETTTFATLYHLPRSLDSVPPSIPIGHPVAGTELYVLGVDLAPVLRGTVGELYIGGPGLARGYVDSPSLTAERFLPNPFESRSRMYRTGDLVRVAPDGSLEFVGRVDDQIKLRGFRVEPGEIAEALRRCPNVQDVFVAAVGTGAAARLIAYVVSSVPIHPGNLAAFALDQLPQHMVPDEYVHLRSLPLTPAGKVDRSLLPPPALPGAPSPQHAVQNVSRVNLAIRTVWEDVLGEAPADSGIDFFLAGGNSLSAAELAAKLRSDFDIDCPLRLLFDNPTVSGLASALEGQYQGSPNR